MKKINTRYNITFQESENAKKALDATQTHTSSIILCVLAGFTSGCKKSFGFVGENVLKLKKTIELRFENSFSTDTNRTGTIQSVRI